MPSASAPRRFNARLAELALLLDAARAACLAARLGAEASRRVELVLEEAFSNSVQHGYGRESDAPIWLASRMLPDGIEVVYQDAAPPFDPLHDASLPNDGRAGGVGRVLMRSLPRQATYAYTGDRNTLTFVFAPSSPA